MKTRHVIAGCLLGIITVSIIGCGGGGGDGSALSGSIIIAGSSTVYPVSMAMAEEFNKLHPGVELSIQSTGTGGGFKNFFIPGKTAINNASRKIKDTEIEKAKANGITPLEFQVAIDAITIVVNPEADFIDDITPAQLKKIWHPENPAQKWSDVDPNWPDEKIELFGPTSASGTFDYFTDAINGEERVSRSDYQGTEKDNTIVTAVSRSKYAMGYFGMAYYLENKDAIKALSVNGVKPSIETARSGKYTPLSRPLFIYVSSKDLAKEEVQTFMQFYLEKTATDLIKEIGYVPMPEDKMKASCADLAKAIQQFAKQQPDI